MTLETGAGAAVQVGHVTFPAATGLAAEGSAVAIATTEDGAAATAGEAGTPEAGTAVGAEAPVGGPLIAEILERASAVLPPAHAEPIALPAEARSIPIERPAAALLKPAALADCAAAGMLA